MFSAVRVIYCLEQFNLGSGEFFISFYVSIDEGGSVSHLDPLCLMQELSGEIFLSILHK